MLPPDRRQDAQNIQDSKNDISANYFAIFMQRTDHFGSICSEILCDRFLGKKAQIYDLNCKVRKFYFKWKALHQTALMLMKSKIYSHVRCVQGL